MAGSERRPPGRNRRAPGQGRAPGERRAQQRRSGGRRRAGAQLSDPPALPERRNGRDRRDEAGWESITIDAQPVVQDLAGEERLVAAARDARERAHARFSGFKVGAALETADGRIITGCNIENATYGLTLCAERVALVKAVSDGDAIFTRMAVVADTEAPTPPCGPCRQLLWEYCGDLDIILANLKDTSGRYRLSALLPLPFDARLLG